LNRNTNHERDRAVLFALVATFAALVIAKIMFGLYWYGAVLFAAVVFGIVFALILRIQRNTRQ
jgi:hypothetical protein